MLINGENIILVGSLLIFVSVLSTKAGYKLGMPALLLFLCIGMLVGSDGLGIQFDSPMSAQFIGMLSLSVILFSGGMDTKFSDIRPVIAPGITLATAGVLITAVITGGFIYYIAKLFGLELSFLESFLMAAVMSSTDSASVFSILRSRRQGLKQNLRPLLELESGSNDPMAYILTILTISAISMGKFDLGASLVSFVIQMSVGAISGYFLGRLTIHVVNHIDIKNKSLYSTLVLALVLFIFSITDLINGNGYLAVYIAGLVVGNNKLMHKRLISTFFDGITWLLQIIMFLTLGLLVNPHELADYHIFGIGLTVAVFIILVSRPISVMLCMAPFRKFSAKARVYISWVGLRGAVPIIFATYPMVSGLENSNLIFNVVFFITTVSLVLQGTTVGKMASLLKLSYDEEEPVFSSDLPDKIKATLSEIKVRKELLVNGNMLKDISLPDKTLIVMVRRGDEYIVPQGKTVLFVGDKLLVISENNSQILAELDKYGIPRAVHFD